MSAYNLPSPQAYQAFYHQGDPLADAAICVIMQDGQRGDLLTRVENAAAREGGPCQAFLAQVNQVPDWVDLSCLHLGQALFLRHAALSITAFVLGSLLVTYTPPGSAKVLLHTGRLRQDVVRRLFETATMVEAVMAPGGMAVGGAGHRAIVRVRLLHAMVRHHVQRAGNWPQTLLGSPINQLQMSLTALGFSSLLIASMKRLGVQATPEEAQAYQMLWRWGNHLQGIDAALLPSTLEDESRLYAFFRQTLMKPDDNSRRLVAAVHEGLAWQSPFFLPKGALQAVSRRLLGTELAQALAIPRRPVWELLLAILSALHRSTGWRGRIPGWRRWETQAGRRYFHHLVQSGLRNRPADYALKTLP